MTIFVLFLTSMYCNKRAHYSLIALSVEESIVIRRQMLFQVLENSSRIRLLVRMVLKTVPLN